MAATPNHSGHILEASTGEFVFNGLTFLARLVPDNIFRSTRCHSIRNIRYTNRYSKFREYFGNFSSGEKMSVLKVLLVYIERKKNTVNLAWSIEDICLDIFCIVR